MNFRKYIPILVALLIIVTTNCVAQTWDAKKDFAASNPNGAWSYGYGITGTSFTLDTVYGANCFPTGGFVCWRTETGDPSVGFNTTGGWLDYGTDLLPPDALRVHDGPDDGQDVIVQWTAPATGVYRIYGYFEILDTAPTGIIGLVYLNGTQIYRGELLGPPAQDPDTPGGAEDFYFDKLSLNAGDVISFGVNSDGSFYYDTTGLNAWIVANPPNVQKCAVCSK